MPQTTFFGYVKNLTRKGIDSGRFPLVFFPIMGNARNGLSKGTRHDKAKVLDVIREGMKLGKPLLAILSENQGMPCAVSVYDWIREDADFGRAFEELREIGADALATECLAIADRHCETMVEVQHRRLMVDTRLRLLAKWQPKKYGDKLELSGTVETVISPLEQLRQIHGARRGGGGGIIEAEMVGVEKLANQPASQGAAVVDNSDCF
tara:strand:- start:122 stop:745 length:624 start_codon:yes stop_codon:yes gene_type:complete